ncbi:MAG: AIPR family protein [Lachnospiraceae bacterium]|nr:AIPR family protein [Lachnospiraceae bacterium]
MNTKTLKFKVETLRTISSPYKKVLNSDEVLETVYFLIVNMKELPGNIPLDVNPREPKMSTNVARRIKDAVTEPEYDFHINNRGIVIAAKSLYFNTSESEVTIDIGDQSDENDKCSYGILDGGHTYTAIMGKRNEIPSDIEKYVRVEVITNVQNITRLSDARNTSAQVSDIALFNLDDNFDYIKNAIAGQVYASEVAYKDNENKPINISEFLRLLYAFDIEKYPNDSAAPTQSYSGKAQVFKRYKVAFNTNFYKALTKQLPKLVSLYDIIEKELSDKYCQYKHALGTANPRFGSVRGIESIDKGTRTQFLHTQSNYSVSTGYIYPIFGAFRSLLKYDEEKEETYWVFDPVEIWNEIGVDIVQNTFETSSNPQLAGKDKQLWLSNYRIVETQSLRKLLKNQKNI